MEEHETLVVQVESGAQEALNKRNKGEEPLVIERNQLKVKLDAVVAQIKENRVHQEKLMAVIANCEKMKQSEAVASCQQSCGVYLSKSPGDSEGGRSGREINSRRLSQMDNHQLKWSP